MKIAILGSGLMGSKLGTLWARSGHQVTFAYSRTETKLARLAEVCGAAYGSVSEAVIGADAILLSVHWSRVEDVLAHAGDMAGQVVINCCVPLDETNSQIVVGMTTSGAEELARQRPRARWVSAFNTSPSESFGPAFAAKGRSEPPQLLMYGDDAGAKTIAAELIRDVGFAPLEAGGLRTARYAEPFAMVTAELAYGQPGGAALAYRFTRLTG